MRSRGLPCGLHKPHFARKGLVKRPLIPHQLLGVFLTRAERISGTPTAGEDGCLFGSSEC